MLSAFIFSAAHTHAAKEYGMSPPLPRDLGRGILGCFLEDERHCVGNSGPPAPTELMPPAFSRVPLGSVIPEGWLGRIQVLQANGMSGWYQALYYPAVNQSYWVGGKIKYKGLNYMATYWLNGNVPLAALLSAAGLRAEHDLSSLTDGYLEYIMRAQDNRTGQLGPDACGGQFSKMEAVRALLAAAESSGSDTASVKRIGASILAGLREMYECTLAGKTSGGIRWPSYIEAILEYLDAYETVGLPL